MKGKHRLFALMLTVVLMFSALPVTASANGPAPRPYFEFEFRNLPEGTVYVDMLIYLPETDPNYREMAQEKLPEGFSAESRIITYCEEDYRSYTFHYYDALSRIKPDRNGHVFFFTDGSNYYDGTSVRYEHEEAVSGRGKIRLAMLDAEGNLLKVSKLLSLRPKGLFAYSLGFFTYDAAEDVLEVDSHSSGLAAVLFLIVGILGIALTCWLERLVSLPFGLKKDYGKLIVRTNIVSQMLMRAAQGLAAYAPLGRGSILPYVFLIILLEILVYLCEFLFYRRRMVTVSWKRCLLYTVTANTVSLLGGLALLYVIFFL